MSFTCPRCGMTSHNPRDAREGYCGNCHDWTEPRKAVRVCLSCCNSSRSERCPFCGGTVITDYLPRCSP